MKIKKEREKKGKKEKVFNAKLEANKPHALSSDGGATKKILTHRGKRCLLIKRRLTLCLKSASIAHPLAHASLFYF